MTDWDAELKKIDRQLESMSDQALIPSAPKSAAPAARAAVAQDRADTRMWPALLRLALASLAAIGILFWPYSSRCGVGLTGYLLAIAGVTVAGIWSSVWTWKHRTARAHVLSLVLVGYGMVLGAVELLPRMGYAKADPLRPAGFSCSVEPVKTVPPTK